MRPISRASFSNSVRRRGRMASTLRWNGYVAKWQRPERLRVSQRSVGVHDFSATVARDGEMVQPLKDPAFFARMFVELGALTWPNGYDLDPIALHDRMAAAGELSREAAE